eukprot:gene5745-6038_t
MGELQSGLVASHTAGSLHEQVKERKPPIGGFQHESYEQVETQARATAMANMTAVHNELETSKKRPLRNRMDSGSLDAGR